MADGDFTIPTYLASPGGNHHCREGLEGKDAVLIEALHNDRGHAEGTRETRSEGRDVLRAVFESRIERERDTREVAKELLKFRCEIEEKVRCEGEKTRDLIKEFRFLDQAAEIAFLKAELLKITPVVTPVV